MYVRTVDVRVNDACMYYTSLFWIQIWMGTDDATILHVWWPDGPRTRMHGLYACAAQRAKITKAS
jgi:hypothetical protein